MNNNQEQFLRGNSFLVYFYDVNKQQIYIDPKNVVQYKFNIAKNNTVINLTVALLTHLIKSTIFQQIEYCDMYFYDDNGNVIDHEVYKVNDLIVESSGNLVANEENFFGYNLKLDVVEEELASDEAEETTESVDKDQVNGQMSGVAEQNNETENNNQ